MKISYFLAMLAGCCLPLSAPEGDRSTPPPVEITTPDTFIEYFTTHSFNKEFCDQLITQMLSPHDINNLFILAANEKLLGVCAHLAARRDCNPLHYDERGLTLFHLAVQTGNMDAVDIMLYRSPSIIDRTDRDERTALHIAANLGLDAMVQKLLDKKANQNARSRDIKQPTPLHCALYSKEDVHLRTLCHLICHEKTELHNDELGKACLNKLCTGRGDIASTERLSAIEACLRKDIISIHVFDWLMHELRNGRMGIDTIIDVLKKHRQLLDCTSQVCGITTLHQAAQLQNCDEATQEQLIRAIIDLKPALLEYVDCHGQTPLTYALHRGNQVTFGAQLLVALGARLDTITTDGYNLLHLLSDKSNAMAMIDHIPGDILARLLNQQDNLGRTPLLFAITDGNEELVRFLLGQSNIDISKADMNWNTAWTLASTRENKNIQRMVGEKMVTIRTRALSPEPEIPAPAQLSVIEEEASMPDSAPPTITTLEEFADFCQITPLDLDAYTQAVNQLCQHVPANDVFSYAAENNIDNEVIGLIVAHPEFNPLDYDADGFMLLHVAVREQRILIVQRLLEFCPETLEGTTHKQAYTPLHLAASESPDLVRMLLEEGANPNAQSLDDIQRTPLMFAMRFANEAFTEALIALVCHPDIELGDQRQRNNILENICASHHVDISRSLPALEICLESGAVSRAVFPWFVDQHNAGKITTDTVLEIITGHPRLLDCIDYDRATPLHHVLALRNDAARKTIIDTLLRLKPSLLNQCDSLLRTPLQRSLERNIDNFTHLLAQKDVVLGNADLHGKTILHLMARHPQAAELASHLPPATLEKLLNHPDVEGCSALLRATLAGNLKFTEFLLNQPNIDITLASRLGTKAEQYAQNSNEQMKQLFAHFASRKSASMPPSPVLTPTSNTPVPTPLTNTSLPTSITKSNTKQLAITGATSVITFTIVLKLLLKNNNLGFSDIFRYTSLTPDQKRALLYATTTAMCVSGLVGANTYCLQNN